MMSNALAVGIFFLTGLSAVGDGVDPAIFTSAGDPPAFRPSLVGPVWDARFPAAVAKFGNLDAVAKSALPEAGARITSVLKDSPAAKLGLNVGDVIVSIGDEPVNLRNMNDLRTDAAQKLIAVSGEGKSKEVTIQPGLIGVGTMSVSWPQRIYLRGKTRDKRWDDLVVIGTSSSLTDPDLAEAAWQRAIAAGYKPDALSDYCGAQIAWRQGRNEDALAFCARLCARADAPKTLDVANLSRQLALANFKIDQAITGKITAEPPAQAVNGADGEDWLPKLLAIHNALPEDRRRGPSPMERFVGGQKSLLSNVKAISSGEKAYDKEHRQDLARLCKAEPITEEIPADHYYENSVRPNVDDPDAQLVFHGTLKAKGPRKAAYLKCLTLRLIDCDIEDKQIIADDESCAFLGIELQTSGTATIFQNVDPVMEVQSVDTRAETAADREFIVRLLHAGGRDEVWLNNRRLLYLPSAATPKRVGFCIFVCGASTKIKLDFLSLDSGEPKN